MNATDLLLVERCRNLLNLQYDDGLIETQNQPVTGANSVAFQDELFEKNRHWACRMTESDPEFFNRLAASQKPTTLWIGCSDSRVPSNQVVDLAPGELFVHRNIANLVIHTDLSCLSVIQFAVEQLKVKHIIVCGHYGCGGVAAAFKNLQLGLIENWLRYIQDVAAKHEDRLNAIDGLEKRLERLCELNVIEQVSNVCRTTIVRDAWNNGQQLSVHGWIYGLADGRLKDLATDVGANDDRLAGYKSALQSLDATV